MDFSSFLPSSQVFLLLDAKRRFYVVIFCARRSKDALELPELPAAQLAARDEGAICLPLRCTQLSSD